MQLLLIVGIAFAISAVTFALQNNGPVTVALAVQLLSSVWFSLVVLVTRASEVISVPVAVPASML